MESHGKVYAEMNELAYHCTVYMKSENETMEEAANRLEELLYKAGLDYQFYDMELRDEDGNVLEEQQ